MISTSVVDLEALLADDPTFEESDEPMAGQPHRDPIDSLFYSLRDHLAGPGVYVAAEVRVYRDLAAVRARTYREPDLLVALDRPDEQRLVYLLSEEGKAPDFVLEVLSDTTYQNDLGEKRRWYRAIGVREYVVIDLEGAYAGERRLQRWRLEEEGPESAAPPDVGLEGETIASLVLP
ncbi:MAG TPA: Uma2 family endonuclease, partial [Chloroflexota bacterium]